MSNNITDLHQIKALAGRFCENISKSLKAPAQKFVKDMNFSILASQSCILSEISRSLNERITVKKTEERLSRGLNNLGENESLLDNLAPLVTPFIGDEPVFLCDNSDIAKTCGKAFEGLSRVHDGSTGEITKGYWTLEISALSEKSHTPIPVYDRLYSTNEKGFVSQNAELFRGLQKVRELYGNAGIFVQDRGYDGNNIYEYFFKNDMTFLIRANRDRDVILKNKRLNILAAAQKYKGKCVLKFKGFSLKTSLIPISLPAFPDKNLTMVTVYGLSDEPLMLLTNYSSDENRLSNLIAKLYFLRWRIEENFRFKKQSFGIEKFRVLSLRSIRALHRLAMISTAFVAILSAQREDKAIIARLVKISKPIFEPSWAKFCKMFLHYSIASAISLLFTRSRVPLVRKNPPFRHSAQLVLPGY